MCHHPPSLSVASCSPPLTSQANNEIAPRVSRSSVARGTGAGGVVASHAAAYGAPPNVDAHSRHTNSATVAGDRFAAVASGPARLMVTELGRYASRASERAVHSSVRRSECVQPLFSASPSSVLASASPLAATASGTSAASDAENMEGYMILLSERDTTGRRSADATGVHSLSLIHI